MICLTARYNLLDNFSGMDAILILPSFPHYENMPIQMYWKFYNQKRKIFR